MINLLSSSLEKFTVHTLHHLHQNHFFLSENIANASTPGFKAKHLAEPIKYKTFCEQANNANLFKAHKTEYMPGEQKPNGNNVDEKEQYRALISNEGSIEFHQSVLQNLIQLNEIAAGLR